MCEHYRIFAPVGSGGFDIEHIDGTTVVFDCGSRPKHNVENCILHYKDYLAYTGKKTIIDYLFLSHFDQDHINGLNALSQHFTIRNIIVPYIPKRYRVIYNYVTNFSVNVFYSLMTQSQDLYGARILGAEQIPNVINRYQSIKSSNGKWEWIYKSIFSCSQWEQLRIVLVKEGILKDTLPEDDNDFFDNPMDESDLESWKSKVSKTVDSWSQESNKEDFDAGQNGISIEDFDIDSYVDNAELTDDQMKRINKAIGELSGQSNPSYAKNENGLLMLSKKKVAKVHSDLFCSCAFSAPFIHHSAYHCSSPLSACVYTGDMRFDVKSCPTILDFLMMAGENLLLFQIPHHGSDHNSSADYLQVLPSELFFWHDKNYSRLNKNASIVNIFPQYRLVLIDTVTHLVCEFNF